MHRGAVALAGRRRGLAPWARQGGAVTSAGRRCTARCALSEVAPLVQGRSRGPAGVGPGAVGAAGCQCCQLQRTCPHGQLAPQACAGAGPGLSPAAGAGLQPWDSGAGAGAVGAPQPAGCFHGPVAAVQVQFILSQGAT